MAQDIQKDTELKVKKKHKIITTAYDNKGVKICTTVNDYNKSHPLQKKLSLSVGLSEERAFLHSEIRCLLKSSSLRRKVNTLRVERYDSEGNPKIAFPCPSCRQGIKLAGVKRVVFTTENGYDEWII